MEDRFKDKVVLITGTGGAQGRVAAGLFAKEGANVVGCDLDADRSKETTKMVKEQGGKMLSLEPMDVSDIDQCKKVIDFTERSFGRLDVLYNNAGSSRFAPATEMSLEDWEHTIRNELGTMFAMTRAALPLLIKSGGGAIVNTSSTIAIAGNEYGRFAHAAAKGGVLSLTRTLAVELARYNIRVNAILPGNIDIGRIQAPTMNNARVEEWIKNCPMRRPGRPYEPVKAAMFLASEEDASFITGQTIVIDGGYTAK